jgi:hypothetical protein
LVSGTNGNRPGFGLVPFDEPASFDAG